MEFEKYEPGKHEELVPGSFSEIVKEPGEFEKFKDAVKQAFGDVREVLGMEANFDVVLGSVDVEKLEDREGEDIPEGFYFRGYSLGREVHDHAGRDIVLLAATTESNYWEAGLKNVAVHEEAHQEFYRFIRNMEHVVWESMVFEGHALVRERKVREEKEYPWKGDPRSYEGSAENIVEVLDKNREWEGEKYDRDNTSSILSMDSDWEGIGYIVAEEVFRNIIERNNLDIDQPLSKDRDWLREQVEKSVRELY